MGEHTPLTGQELAVFKMQTERDSLLQPPRTLILHLIAEVERLRAENKILRGESASRFGKAVSSDG